MTIRHTNIVPPCLSSFTSLCPYEAPKKPQILHFAVFRVPNALYAKGRDVIKAVVALHTWDGGFFTTVPSPLMIVSGTEARPSLLSSDYISHH